MGDESYVRSKIFDAVSGGPLSNLVKTTNVNLVTGGAMAIGISSNDPSLAPGTHTIHIITDADGNLQMTG